MVSGSGMKVDTLLQMPAAWGLFHKANYDHALMSAHAKYAPPLNLRPKF